MMNKRSALRARKYAIGLMSQGVAACSSSGHRGALHLFCSQHRDDDQRRAGLQRAVAGAGPDAGPSGRGAEFTRGAGDRGDSYGTPILERIGSLASVTSNGHRRLRSGRAISWFGRNAEIVGREIALGRTGSAGYGSNRSGELFDLPDWSGRRGRSAPPRPVRRRDRRPDRGCQGEHKIFALTDIGDAVETDAAQRAGHGLPLRVEYRTLQRDINMRFHQE